MVILGIKREYLSYRHLSWRILFLEAKVLETRLLWSYCQRFIFFKIFINIDRGGERWSFKRGRRWSHLTRTVQTLMTMQDCWFWTRDFSHLSPLLNQLSDWSSIAKSCRVLPKTGSRLNRAQHNGIHTLSGLFNNKFLDCSTINGSRNFIFEVKFSHQHTCVFTMCSGLFTSKHLRKHSYHKNTIGNVEHANMQTRTQVSHLINGMRGALYRECEKIYQWNWNALPGSELLWKVKEEPIISN